MAPAKRVLKQENPKQTDPPTIVTSAKETTLKIQRAPANPGQHPGAGLCGARLTRKGDKRAGPLRIAVI